MSHQTWDKTIWEKREGNGQHLGRIKAQYEDLGITIRAISTEFNISDTALRGVARRLGWTLRPRRIVQSRVKPQITLAALDQEEEALREKLRAIELKKSDLTVRVEKKHGGSEVTVFGLTEQPFITSTTLAREWLKSMGAVKLREAVGA